MDGLLHPRLARLAVPTIGVTPQVTTDTMTLMETYVDRVVDPQATLDVVVGRPRLVVLKRRPLRVQIPDETFATFDLVTDEQILVTGKKSGTTLLTLWFTDSKNPGKEDIWSYLVRVFPDPEEKERLERTYEALESELNLAFPNSNVKLLLVGDKVVLKGEAYDAVEAAQILRIVQDNVRGGTEEIPAESIRIDPEQLGPDGLPPLALENYLLSTKANIINALRIPGEAQIMLRVVVAEVNRSALRSIGLNFNVIADGGKWAVQNLTGGIDSQNLDNVPFRTRRTIDGHTYELNAALNILRSLNLAQSLAEPNLTALNGRKATLLAGGQFPVPVVTGATNAGLQGVDFVPFGVKLEFTPFVTDRDRVRLQVTAEVSTRQTASGTRVGTAAIPGLDTRRFTTVVDLREGQTLAVAGLLQSNFGSTADRIPFLGDLPFIGQLFGFNRTSASEQELVILVSPELVYPMEEGEVPPLPGSDMFEPTDLEFYLFNRLESRNLFDFRSVVRTDFERLSLFRRGDQEFIEGPSGYSPQEGGGT